MNIIDNETIIIHRAQKGNQTAFKTLYDAHVVSLFRFLKQFSRDPDEVSEWVQRAFIKAFEHLPAFREEARFSSWLFTLGLNEMRMDRRRSTMLILDPCAREELPAEGQDSEQFTWDATMKTMLDKLDDNKRMVFLLYEVEGYSHTEIAEMLNVGESTSRTILTRAKRQLKELWNQEVC
jgi:RNA polymerase sigma factor (sigma-70 family)